MSGCYSRQWVEMDWTCDKSLQNILPKSKETLPNEEYAKDNIAVNLQLENTTISPLCNCHPEQLFNFADVKYWKVHIRAARFFFRLKKSISDNEVLQTVNWKSITHYCKRTLANKAFKIYNNLTSSLLAELIKQNQTLSRLMFLLLNMWTSRNHFSIELL